MPPILPRYLAQPVAEDLRSKLVFVGGPRQVGKTTFALGLVPEGHKRHPAYLNWDVPEGRSAILKGELPPNQSLVVLDEVHKFARWRSLLKGFYDRYVPEVSFLVTGSARLDHYRKGGDSLQGRYHYFRLHPFSAREVNPGPSAGDIRRLLQFGGFPEPFLRASETFHRRWQRERLTRVVNEDLRDLERVREVSLIEVLLESLPERVGSPLSVRSLSEDLQVSHASIERWVTILENLYVCFRLLPFGSPRIRAVKKEKKLYFWDWSQAPEGGARFENLVACQLLKYCHWREDCEGYRMELRYVRDTDGREVDFVVLQDRKPLFGVECKSSDKQLDPAIGYFQARTKVPRFYQVHLAERDFGSAEHGGRVLPFHTFCRELGLP
jgi:predicted AAA+ superfamily ATPase